MKPISPGMHGILDYGTAGILLALPRLLRWSARVTRFMTLMAVVTMIYSIFTRYPLGLLKVLPMRAHLMLDSVNAVTFLAAPLLFRKEDRGVIAALMGMGLFEMGATLLSRETEAEPPSSNGFHVSEHEIMRDTSY
jgi:hypothetical protein